MHPPSTLAVSLASTTVSDGAGVSLAANTGALSQEWEWPAAATGGTIASAANERQLHDHRLARQRRRQHRTAGAHVAPERVAAQRRAQRSVVRQLRLS